MNRLSPRIEWHRFFVVALVLGAPLGLLVLPLLPAVAVVRRVWGKERGRLRWRVAGGISLMLALGAGLMCAFGFDRIEGDVRLVGFPFQVQTPLSGGFAGFEMAAFAPEEVLARVVNLMLVSSLLMLPLSMASAVYENRRRAKN